MVPRRTSVRRGQPGGAVLAQVVGTETRSKWPGSEAIGGAGQCAHRADLHGVAGEGRVEALIGGGADLLLGASFEQARASGRRRSARRTGCTGAQETQRSRSSRICALTLIGLGKVRLGGRSGQAGRPTCIAWFCSGHSPPLSHTGQSSGWFSSRNSITPSWASAATGRGLLGSDLHPVGDHRAQAGCGLGSALDLDQAGPAGCHRIEERVVAESRDPMPRIRAGGSPRCPWGPATPTVHGVTVTASTGVTSDPVPLVSHRTLAPANT
jgi:hypothetical protein